MRFVVQSENLVLEQWQMSNSHWGLVCARCLLGVLL